MARATQSHPARHDSDPVTDLCDLIRDEVGCERVSVWSYDHRRRRLMPRARSPGAPTPFTNASGGMRLWVDHPAIAKLAHTLLFEGDPVDIDEPLTAVLPQRFVDALELTTLRCEPLHADHPLGTLVLEPSTARLSPGAAPAVRALCSLLAEQAARRDLELDREAVHLLDDLLEVTTEERTFGWMLHTICRRLAQHLEMRRATVYFFGGSGELVPRMSAFADEEPAPELLETLRHPAAETLERLAAFGDLIRDIQGPLPLERPDQVGTWFRETFDIESVLIVPIRHGDTTLGAIAFDNSKPHVFSHDRLSLASALGDHLGRHVDHFRSVQQRSQELRSIRILNDLLRKAAETTSLEEMGAVLTASSREALGAEHAFVCVLDEDRRIVHVAGEAAAPELAGALRSVLEQWRTDDLQTPGFDPYIGDDPQGSTLPRAISTHLGVSACAVIPLVSWSRPLGLVVCTHAHSSRYWSTHDRWLAERLALEGALLIENAAHREAERERVHRLSEEVRRLADLERVRDTVVSTVSHELRTPLTIIKGSAATLLDRREALSAEQYVSLLRALYENADSLEHILDRLLDLSRLRSGKLQPQRRPFPLHELLDRTVRRLASLLDDHQLTVDIHTPLWVDADPDLIERVAENLLTNAARHTPLGTSIHLDARLDGSQALVSVTDEGGGIPPEDLAHLGRPFFQANTSSDRAGGRGLGLGLALSYEILRLHQSRLEIESALGKGARFSFFLPCGLPEGSGTHARPHAG